MKTTGEHKVESTRLSLGYRGTWNPKACSYPIIFAAPSVADPWCNLEKCVSKEVLGINPTQRARLELLSLHRIQANVYAERDQKAISPLCLSTTIRQ